jgi:hypothetical protein
MLTRAYAVSDPHTMDDPEYVTGLRAAISAALTYGLAAIELGQDRYVPIPPAVLAQARQAARSGVNLDTVLRRYFAGYTLLGDFVMQEAEGGEPLGIGQVHRFERDQAALFDRLLVAITDEYAREAQGCLKSSEERRAERVRQLLAGQPLDTSQLGYEIEAWHIGVLISGPGAAEGIGVLAAALDRRLLLVSGGEETSWAWLGGRREVNSTEVERLVSAGWPTSTSLAVGEPGYGLAGWRLSHRQARAAMPVVQRGSEKQVRYADVALLASMLQDDLLTTSLRQLYLVPLEAERDGGEVLRKTLRAFFAAERQVSSAAAALGVKRHTVTNRLRAVEERLERPLTSCAEELAAALRLEDLGVWDRSKADSST